jgi:zinc transport system permease protein
VQTIDLYLVTAATVVLLGGHLFLWRALIFVGYDPTGARVQGMPVRALNAFLFVSVGLAVALCTRALGALPVFAFSVLPAMTALAFTSRIGFVFVLATLVGAFSGVAGYAVSFRAELPVGATQAATGAVLLTAALLWRLVMAQRDRRRARNQPPSVSAGSTTVADGSTSLPTSPASERASTASAPRTDAA